VTTVQLIALTVGASGALPTLAAHIRVPSPIVLLVAGIAVALLPGVPDLELDPFVVILLLLPPIVYAATLRSSLRRLFNIARWAVVPGVVLILAPMIAVAVAAHVVVDGLAWSSAFVLGGIAAVTGAEALVGADARLGLPRRLLTRLRAETTVLPLVLLPLILIAIDAGVKEEFAPWSAGAGYLYDVFGGLAIGAVVGLLGVWARRRTADGPPQIAVSFAIPFLASLAGYAADASSIAAIIAAGFVIEAHYSGRATGLPYSASTQELGRAFWLQATLLLSGALAFIVGLSIPAALEGVDVAAGPMIAYVAGALAVVAGVRFLVAWTSSGRGRDADRISPAREGLMLAWGGARTPLAFVLALLVPVTVESGAPFPDRDLVLVFTAALVVASAVLQGTTVSALARLLGLTGDEGVRREEQIARARVMEAGRERSLAIAGGGTVDQGDGSLTVFDAERAALVHLYDADEIGEETLLRLRQEIDAEAQRAVDGSSDFAVEPSR
jgi:NhaP-type Na+/H+ or K+/H+ antiporter